MVKLKYRAKVVEGAGRGKRLGIPTVNLDPKKAKGLKEGIYLCRVNLLKSFWGVLHFGPRPVFNEEEKTLEVFDYIREVADFESPKKLIEKIEDDIRIAKQKIKSYQIR